MPFPLGCLGAYLLGGVPFALVIVWVLKGVDVRTVGSGNVGATNAARAFRARGARLAMFAAIYVLDFGKGFVPAMWGAGWFDGPPSAAVWLGAAAIMGHCASPFLGLRGGKGVATTTGVMAAIEPLALGCGIAMFAVVAGVTRQVFLGSLALGATMAVVVVLRDVGSAFDERLAHSLFAVAVALLFVWTHRSNLRRMLSGRATSTEVRL